MNLSIDILDKEGNKKAGATGSDCVTLVYHAEYIPGDFIRISTDTPGHVKAMLEDTIPPVLAFLDSSAVLKVPFGERKTCYSPKSFVGSLHLLTAHRARPKEIFSRRNQALNPLDSHENSGLFPHASANVETRGESVFAARNAIDGQRVNNGHGAWPYQSWGINQNPQAVIKIDFGRPVCIDEIVITLRADFPHDNWRKTAEIIFSNGWKHPLVFERTVQPQYFKINPQVVKWAKMHELKRDESNPSPFPALTEIEFWGTEEKE